MRRILLPLVVCLCLAPLAAPAQEPADAGVRIDALMTSFAKTKDAKAKRKILADLVKIGEPAFLAVEKHAEAMKAEAATARKAVGENPDPATLESLRKADAKARSAAKIRDGVHMAIVVAAFRVVEKTHKDLNLVYPGQFDALKAQGKRAALGAILLMKDLDLYDDKYRYKAWEVLADLGDKSVMKPLATIAEDFLMEDPIREGAVCALSALGDTKLIMKKIREFENDMREDPRRQVSIAQQIASLYHHGRQYQQAAVTYARLLSLYEGVLEERASEMQKSQVENIKGAIANFGYNGACALSLAKNYPGAYAMLAKCLQAEKDPARQLENILRDGDLANLRAEKHFKAWYENAKKGEFPERPPGAPAPPAKEKAEGEEAEKPKTEPPSGEEPGQKGGAGEDPEKAGGAPEPKKSPPPAPTGSSR